MSNKSIVIALLLAVVLGVVTVVVAIKTGAVSSGGAASIAPGEPVLSLVPSQVVSMSVTPPAPARAELIERDPKQPGKWVLSSVARSQTEGVKAVASGSTWPVDATRMRSVLDILAGLKAAGTAPAGSTVGDGATVVSIKLEDGSERTLKLAARTLGGQGLIEVTGPAAGATQAVAGAQASVVTRAAMVPDAVINMFTSPGPRGWRELQLLSGVATDASRIRIITAAGAGLAMGKVQGRWGVREPVAGGADGAAVQRLLSVLENVRAGRFFDDGVILAKDAGLDSPTAQIVIESDTAGVATKTLTIGGKADAAGKTYYATTDGGGTIVSIDTETINKIRPLAEEYLAGQATGLAPADIAVLMFKGSLVGAPSSGESPAPPVELGFRRDLTRWMELRPDGKDVMQDPARVKQIEGMLEFLTSQKAAFVWLAEPAAFAPVGTLRLAGATGDVLEEIEVGTSGPAALVMRTGKVLRGYTSVPDLLRGAVGSLEPAALLGPDGKPIEREIMK